MSGRKCPARMVFSLLRLGAYGTPIIERPFHEPGSSALLVQGLTETLGTWMAQVLMYSRNEPTRVCCFGNLMGFFSSLPFWHFILQNWWKCMSADEADGCSSIQPQKR